MEFKATDCHAFFTQGSDATLELRIRSSSQVPSGITHTFADPTLPKITKHYTITNNDFNGRFEV